MLYIVLLIIVTIFIGVAVFMRRTKFGRFPWIQFFLKGKESGFNFREINLLRKRKQ